MKQRISEEQVVRLAVLLGALTALISLGLYAYLGTFSRYWSDDYCLSAFFLKDDLLHEMVNRYFISSSRYTNILFIGLVDKLFGWQNVVILPALMLALFVLGLYLLLKEIAALIKLGWSRWPIFFLAISLAYFSIAQAPSLSESLYWRAGMTSHFAPLVFIPFWLTFLLGQIRRAGKRSPSTWAQVLSFSLPFVIGGFSEPPAALMITGLALAFLFVWWRRDIPHRRSILIVLGWSLLGALAALTVLVLAPANALRMKTSPPGLSELVLRIIYYPAVFIIDTLRTLPVPTFASLALPALLFYVKYAQPSSGLSREARSRLGLLLLLVLALTYLFLAASMAPSAYGQSYPAARARFICRLLMTVALMTEGALLGAWAATVRTPPLQSKYLRGLAILALIILAFYPWRGAWRTFGEIPFYRQRTAAWDERDAEIRRLQAEGVQDVVVWVLRKVQVQDLGDYKDFRLNRCAAALYGVKSVVAVPMENK